MDKGLEKEQVQDMNLQSMSARDPVLREKDAAGGQQGSNRRLSSGLLENHAG